MQIKLKKCLQVKIIIPTFVVNLKIDDMKNHKIDIGIVKEFENEHAVTIAMSWSTYSDKQLKGRLTGEYEVWEREVLIIRTLDVLEAIKKYNELP